MGAAPNVSKEQYVEVAKVYHALLREYWSRIPGSEAELQQAQHDFDAILSDPAALRLKASCYLLYRDLREQIGDVQSSDLPWFNDRIKSELGTDTPYVVGAGQP